MFDHAIMTMELDKETCVIKKDESAANFEPTNGSKR